MRSEKRLAPCCRSALGSQVPIVCDCSPSARAMKLTTGAEDGGQLVGIDEVFDYFKNHPQNLDRGPRLRTAPLAGVVCGESIDAGGEAAL